MCADYALRPQWVRLTVCLFEIGPTCEPECEFTGKRRIYVAIHASDTNSRNHNLTDARQAMALINDIRLGDLIDEHIGETTWSI
jgi:hypothetical protein